MPGVSVVAPPVWTKSKATSVAEPARPGEATGGGVLGGDPANGQGGQASPRAAERGPPGGGPGGPAGEGIET